MAIAKTRAFVHNARKPAGRFAQEDRPRSNREMAGIAMKPKLVRAQLIVAVFALLALLSITGHYFAAAGMVPPPPKTYDEFGLVLLTSFRHYLTWAILTPGILWLGRRIPLTRGRWRRPLLFHLVAPLAGGWLFFVVRILVGAATGTGLPSWGFLSSSWWTIVINNAVGVPPIYWLLVGSGAALRFYRDVEARQLRASELRRSLATAQLDALRMKLQPHFLFNTLNAISCLAEAGDTEGVIRVVERLGNLLRMSMETDGRQMVTLDDELALLDEYLGIEEVRFKDQLHIVRRVDPDVRHALVPSLILQPLVENAVTHGLARRLGSGLLEIAARRDGSELSIAVRDDGPGLPPGWTLTAGAGRGLRNVIERLRALYSGASRFEVTNGATGGAVALMRLPFLAAVPPARGGADDGSHPDARR
jgi:two-component system LytT family sensor kinase